MNMLDLFSGIGGFSLAGKWAGFETVQFVEKDLFCQKVLTKNFPNVPIHDDIKTFDATKYKGQITLLTGGFPCQPFSVAGKKKGINDDRYLWPEMLRIIRECEPNWIVAENVGGIVAMELDNIIDDLENQGYETQSYIIPACASGAPHKRDRLWIVANRLRDRCDNRLDNNTERNLHDNIYGNISTHQKEWKDLLCQPWEAFVTQDWLGFATDTNGSECDQRTEDNATEPKRFEREIIASEVGKAGIAANPNGLTCERQHSTSNSYASIAANNNSVTSQQTYTRTEPITQERKTWLGYSGQNRPDQAPTYWQEDQPPIPGMDDGLSKRLDGVARNKALGNAIVPQVVYPIMKLIAEIELWNRRA